MANWRICVLAGLMLAWLVGLACAWAQDVRPVTPDPPATPVEAFSIHRWAEGDEGCELRIADGVELKTLRSDDVELSVAFAAGHRQYWIYLKVTNHGHWPVTVRPETSQLLSLEPYERQMLYRPVGAILAVTKRLANGDAAYAGPPLPLQMSSGLFASPDYAAMNRMFRVAEADPSDPTELAWHLANRLLAANTVEPGHQIAGFVLFEAPPPLLLKHGLIERSWDPTALLLTVRIGVKYLQVPLEVDP